MIWYFCGVVLHILIVILWIGQLCYWTIIVTPLRVRSGAAGDSQGLQHMYERFLQKGWLYLGISLVTGIFLLYYQGTTVQEIISGTLLRGRFTHVLQVKLLLVGAMAILQCFAVPHRQAVSWLLLATGFSVIGLSIVLVR